jgi:hypothetical protein
MASLKAGSRFSFIIDDNLHNPNLQVSFRQFITLSFLPLKSAPSFPFGKLAQLRRSPLVEMLFDLPHHFFLFVNQIQLVHKISFLFVL